MGAGQRWVLGRGPGATESGSGTVSAPRAPQPSVHVPIADGAARREPQGGCGVMGWRKVPAQSR